MRHYTDFLPGIPLTVVIFTGLVSFSRILALYQGLCQFGYKVNQKS